MQVLRVFAEVMLPVLLVAVVVTVFAANLALHLGVDQLFGDRW